ncbi:MAG: pentapeptide repeat-containing protein [Actinomycetota bacterium]|nr:pentapeptide repeat-containing protein [Actinomycetota bacterium]
MAEFWFAGHGFAAERCSDGMEIALVIALLCAPLGVATIVFVEWPRRAEPTVAKITRSRYGDSVTIPPQPYDRRPLGRDLGIGLLIGAVFASTNFWVDARLSERTDRTEAAREERETQREDLRFVREAVMAEREQMPFAGLDLRGAPLSGFDLTGATLTGTNLAGADLADVVLRDADLTGADLTAADLANADLFAATLTDADLTDAELAWGHLGWADLSGATLVGADLLGAELEGVGLRGADLRGADLKGADLSVADLSDAELAGADLRGADLTDARLDGVDLADVLHSDSTTWPAGVATPSEPMADVVIEMNAAS